MICVVCQDLPDNLPGFTVYHEKQEYLIFINDNMGITEQTDFYKCEMEKIKQGTYVKEIVRSAHNK